MAIPDMIFLQCSLIAVVIFSLPSIALTAGPSHLTPRVPLNQIEKARALINPLDVSSAVVEKGKMLYEGKGTCVNCHGPRGNGRGPGAKDIEPPPRNFQHMGFWRHRTEGEIFWVIKHGSSGTAMIPFGGLLTDQEIWAIIRYEQTFAHGPGGPRGKGPCGGRRMGPHSHGSPHHQGGHEPCC